MIRKLELSDIDAAIRFGDEMRRRSRFRGYPLHWERSAFILSELILNPDVYSRAVDVDGLQGVLLGEVTTDLFVDVQRASTFFLYARQAAQIVCLIKDFKAWAAPRAHFVTVDVSGGVDDARLLNILERRTGLAPAGGRVLVEVSHGS